MHISKTLVAAAATASTVAAVPLAARQSQPLTSNFALQAVDYYVPNNYNGSYIYSSHTGGGTGIAAASLNASFAMTANLLPPSTSSSTTNDGYQVGFTFVGNQYNSWYMNVDQTDFSSSTSPVTISSTNGPDPFGFFFGGNGLYWNGTSFAGWAICPGSYDVPQLFAVTNNAVNLASGCEPVYLYSVAAPNPV